MAVLEIITALGDQANTPQPHDVRLVPRPTVGRSLSNKPIRQGHAALECTYRLMTQTKLKWLMDRYNPENPAITLKYPDPQYGSRTVNAVMLEPEYGGMIGPHYSNVIVRFVALDY